MDIHRIVLPFGVGALSARVVEEEGLSRASFDDSPGDVKLDDGVVSFDGERQEGWRGDPGRLLAGGRCRARGLPHAGLRLALALQQCILLDKGWKVGRKTPGECACIGLLRAWEFALSVNGRNLSIRPDIIFEDLLAQLPLRFLSGQ